MKIKGKPTKEDKLIGKNLKKIRLYRGLSQNQIAVKIGISFQQIQKYEKGTNRISGSRFIDLANELEVPIMAFFEGVFPLNKIPSYQKISERHFQILNKLGKINDPDFDKSILNLCKNMIFWSENLSK